MSVKYIVVKTVVKTGVKSVAVYFIANRYERLYNLRKICNGFHNNFHNIFHNNFSSNVFSQFLFVKMFFSRIFRQLFLSTIFRQMFFLNFFRAIFSSEFVRPNFIRTFFFRPNFFRLNCSSVRRPSVGSTVRRSVCRLSSNFVEVSFQRCR